jgi:hypothetical protein
MLANPILTNATLPRPEQLWHAIERARLAAVGRSTSLADGQIAATAAVHDATLVTARQSSWRIYRQTANPVRDTLARHVVPVGQAGALISQASRCVAVPPSEAHELWQPTFE